MSLNKVFSVHFYCETKPNAQAGQRVRALYIPDSGRAGDRSNQRKKPEEKKERKEESQQKPWVKTTEKEKVSQMGCITRSSLKALFGT